MGKGKYLRQEKASIGKKIGRVVLIFILILVLLIGAVAAFVWSKIGKITYHEPEKQNDKVSVVETEPLSTDSGISDVVVTEPADILAETEPQETLDDSDLVMVTAPSYSDGAIFRDKDVINILLVGTDERTEGFVEACRGDVNIMVSINKAEKTVKLVSFSRGIAIKMLDGPYKGSYEWLTNAHRWAGPIAVMQEMENCFKIELDRYVRVNFNTVMTVVDEIDGIDMELTEAEVKFMNKYRKGYWDLQVGMNTLDGLQALTYARLRGIDTDWYRIQRQRKCILAVVEKLKGSSFSTLNDLCDEVMPMIQTNLTKNEIAELILYSPKFLESEFSQMTIPYQEKGYGGIKCFSGVSGWALNYEKENKVLHEFLFGADAVN